MEFKRAYLVQGLGLPNSDRVVEDCIVTRTSWSEVHEIVFKLDGKYYRTAYSCGLKESQHKYPWEFDNYVDCDEVKKVVVDQWIKKEEK